MDTNTTVLLLVAILAILVVVGIVLFRRNQTVKASVQGPYGTGASLETEREAVAAPSELKPGVTVEEVTSKEGGILAEDKTGKGTVVRKADVQDDIIATSETPEESDPKA